MGYQVQDKTHRVDQVIRSIEAGDEWTPAQTRDQAHLYQLLAAHNVGFSEPFTAEQEALNSYLTSIKASKRLCSYAWRQYASTL
ncbi:hypothetical protein ACJ3XI_00255 [Litorimonas sp. RW-G-Af-16]|uniref:hypothetical protein n=1 Tax=Litorimonas sp. RW-G-Af-16 TaxID=3241168 RepID=UPI00390C5486